jgi:hypothetical protein
MTNTKTWAESLKVETDENLSPVPSFSKLFARSASQVATRAIILQGVVAVAFEVDAKPIVSWFKDQGMWEDVTPAERAIILGADSTESQRIRLQWKQEAEWTLLWMIGKVESLGLPNHYCDTRRLADEIIPALGSDVANFVGQAELRSPGALLAEDLRTYNLWCYALGAQRRREKLPDDLDLYVLEQRRYAFEWMDGFQEWDFVTCDA